MATRCFRCKRWSNADEGLVFKNPLRLVCGVCLLAVEPESSFQERLTAKTQSGFAPFPYQVQTAQRMATTRCFLNGNRMGVGKPIEAAVGALRADMPNLLVVPSSMKRTWSREITEWRPDLTWVIADSSLEWAGHFREISPGACLIGSYALLPGNACSGCASREIKACAHAKENHPEFITRGGKLQPFHLPRGWDEPLKPRGWHPPMALPKCWGCKQRNPMPKIGRPFVILADECHALKSPNAQQVIKWRALARQIFAKGGHVYGLSGTQYENHPGEGWEVLASLGLEKASFGTWDLYSDLFSDYLDNPKGERSPPKGHKLREVHIRLRRVRTNRKTEDVLKDLPPRRVQVIKVDLNKKHLKAVEKAVQRMFATRRAWKDVEEGLLANPHDSGLSEDELIRRNQLYQARIDLYFNNRPWTYDTEVIEAVKEILKPKNRHPGIDMLSKVRRLLSLAKLQAVENWVRTCEEESEPIALFSQHVDIIKKFGEWLNYSPSKIENLFRGYTAGLGNYAIGAVDAILKGTGVLPSITLPTGTLADVPIIKAFVVRDPYGTGSASVEKFYDNFDKLTEGEGFLRKMREAGEVKKYDAYKLAHPELLYFEDYEKIEERTGERVPYSGKKVALDFRVFVDPENPVAKVVIGDSEVILTEGDFSEWVEVEA